MGNAHFYFFLLIIQSFLHFIGNFIFTNCPFTPGLISCISSFVSSFHNFSILILYGSILFGIIISNSSPNFNLFFISIVDFSSLYSTTFPPNS